MGQWCFQILNSMTLVSKHNMKKTKTYRQGDVLIIPVDSIPQGKKQTKRIRLANGEVTGHHHSIFDQGAVGYADDEESLTEFLDVSTPVELEHQEHDTITIGPGKYRSVIQSEYTPQEIRRVAD